MPQEVISTFSLVTGEDTYASQTAQDPTTARRVLSFIPSINGELKRESTYPVFGSQLPGPVLAFKQFDFAQSSGALQSFYFAVAQDSISLQYKLYQYTSGVFTQVSTVGILDNIPMFTVFNNQLHMDDGNKAWLFDGTAWVLEGLPIMAQNPSLQIFATFSPLTTAFNRYYWTSWADHTTTRAHESDASPISVGIGVQTNKTVRVYFMPGSVSTVSGSPTITGAAGTGYVNGTLQTNFLQAYVGYKMYINGAFAGNIVSVADNAHLTLDQNQASTASGLLYTIAPPRVTHWHIYTSISDNSQIGGLLTQVPIATGSYDDQQPFPNVDPTSLINVDINIPVRNDPPATGQHGLAVMATHKFRTFRRRVNKPNQFFFSANEEVEVNSNGSPAESYPGVDPATISDIDNEQVMPDNSFGIRAMVSHGDALYIGTERAIWPWFGETISDFSFTQHQVFSVGQAGRFASVSTPFGLVFFSYDKKMYLYPSFGVPQADTTTALVEIGRPMRKTFEAVDSADLLNMGPRVVYYEYGRRNWLVFSYLKNDATRHTWVFDFETHGWFELQQGFVSTHVFDFGGKKLLVGGDAQGNTWVIDDLTGFFTPTNSCPTCIFRPALMDFGNPEGRRIFRYVEYELTNPDMPVQLKFWLDPADVDNPGTANATLVPVQTRIGSNLFRAYVPSNVGSVCHRLLLELSVPADTNAGAIRSLKLVADPVSSSQ